MGIEFHRQLLNITAHLRLIVNTIHLIHEKGDGEQRNQRNVDWLYWHSDF